MARVDNALHIISMLQQNAIARIIVLIFLAPSQIEIATYCF